MKFTRNQKREIFPRSTDIATINLKLRPKVIYIRCRRHVHCTWTAFKFQNLCCGAYFEFIYATVLVGIIGKQTRYQLERKSYYLTLNERKIIKMTSELKTVWRVEDFGMLQRDQLQSRQRDLHFFKIKVIRFIFSTLCLVSLWNDSSLLYFLFYCFFGILCRICFLRQDRN